LVRKSESNNFRATAIRDVITHIKAAGIEVAVYEAVLEESFFGVRVVNYLDKFK